MLDEEEDDRISTKMFNTRCDSGPKLKTSTNADDIVRIKDGAKTEESCMNMADGVSNL